MRPDRPLGSLAAGEDHAAAQRELVGKRRHGPKRGFLPGGNGLRVRQRDRQRILLHVVDAKLVMQVRAGRPTGLPT